MKRAWRLACGPMPMAYAAVGALTGCAAGGEPPPPEPVPAVLIQFRLVAQEAGAGAEAFEFGEETVHLDPEVIAFDGDLARPRIADVAGGLQLDVRFTADAGVRFDQALLDDTGRQVALVVDARIWRVLDVRPQLGASVLRATLPVSENYAARLRDIVDTRWP